MRINNGCLKSKQSIMKTWLPLLYLRKNVRDGNFFRDLNRKRNDKRGLKQKINTTGKTIVSVLKAASLVVLSLKGYGMFRDQRIDNKDNEVPQMENIPPLRR